MKSVKAVCTDCSGTGLYQGMCEPKGTAVVCLVCGGTGASIIEYSPFTKRRPARGVKTVHRSRGSFIATGTGPMQHSVTYAEFAAGKLPKGG